MDSAQLKTEVITCLCAGPPRWGAVAAELSPEVQWLCSVVAEDGQSSGKAVADYRGLFAETLIFAEWCELSTMVAEGFDILRTQLWARKRWETGCDGTMNDDFPADRLFATYGNIPVGWHRRWTECGGKVRGGLMVARKNDPVWARISDFGQPFPPFEWSGRLDVEHVSRKDAERYRLVETSSLPTTWRPPRVKKEPRPRPPPSGCIGVVLVVIATVILAVKLLA